MRRILLLGCVFVGVGGAQTSAIQLNLGLAGHVPTFHVGEAIPLQLVFSASGSELYDISMRNYDRSGRLNLEAFHVTPEGRDPLKSYYSRGGFLGGGLSGGPLALNEGPQTMREDLNEWIALDHPGHYELYVESGRVTRRIAGKNEFAPVRSNSIEFDVMAADAAWVQQEVLSVNGVLDNPGSTQDERRAALRRLRFLNSDASVPALVHWLGSLPDGERWECVAGLFGSPNQELVVKTLEQGMSDADVALTQEYFQALSKLKFQLTHSLPTAYPQDEPEQQKLWQQHAQKDEEELAAVRDELLDKAAGLVPTKRGSAQATTILTLVQLRATSPLPSQDVAAAFANASPLQQNLMLSGSWEQTKSPAMVEPLRRLLQQPRIDEHLLRDQAMRRLFELDEDEGTAAILDEIRKPHLLDRGSGVSLKTLSLLADATLPQFDNMLAERLRQGHSLDIGLSAGLIGRYASATILPAVKAVYETAPGRWDCITEDGFVVYFLRVDPDYGVRRLIAAPSSCLENSIPAVIRMNRWNEVEPAVIKSLNNPDLNRARQAAETLARYGGSQAEKEMWKRLKSFHEQWAKREEDFTYRANGPKDAADPIGFQTGLVAALGRAQGWVLTDDEVTGLEKLTLGPEKENVKQWHVKSPIDVIVTGTSATNFMVSAGLRYSSDDLALLRAKLAQYPAGTKLQISNASGLDALKPVIQAIREAALEHGLVILNQP